MMKLLIVLVVLVGTAGLSGLVFTPKASCALCPTIRCINKGDCWTGCACFKHSRDVWGSCVSLD